MKSIDAIDWFSARRDGLGDLYECLLEKNATETKSGAGQYFTPRPLIDTIVALIDPKPGEAIQDPAAGTAGFLIAADAHIKARTDELYDLDEKLRSFQRNKAFIGMELVPGTRRLKDGGRAAVVLPDNVLFFDKVGQHAEGGTQEVWVYDLRANMPRFGKRTPLTRAHFADFEAAHVASPRIDQGEQGRFRRFSRDWIRECGDSLDIAWLKDDNAEDAADLPEPVDLAREAMGELEGALAELRALMGELGEEVE